MMVGYSKTGKTSSIKDDVRLNKFFKLSSDDIHDLLNSKLSFFSYKSSKCSVKTN